MMEKYILLDELHNADYEKAYMFMDRSRRKKIDRLLRDSDKKRSLAGEFLAKTLLAEALASDFENIKLLQDEKGKPYVPGKKVYVSISHSENMVVAAVSDMPIGVDVEKLHKVSYNLAKRICFPDELEYIFGAQPSENSPKNDLSGDALRKFFEIWTLKEAYFKCFGSPSGIFYEINVLKENFSFHRNAISDYIITTVTGC